MAQILKVLKLKKIFKDLVFLRTFEEILSNEYHPSNEMRCPVHFCIGQEAIPSVLKNHLRKNDFVFSHHRSHGYFFSKSIKMQKLVSELYGKRSGANKGIAGSQDISYPKQKFFAGAILGGSIGIAVGKALDEKLKKTNNIVVVGFGESACDVGIFWEAINYANLKNLPIIFICENNDYSVFSPQKNRQSGRKIYQKVKQFSLKNNSVSIDGNDVIEINKTFENAFKYVRSNKGPYFIEAKTYRISAHYGPNTDYEVGYRTKIEVENWKKKCPLSRLNTYLVNKKIITSNFLTKYKNQIEKKIFEMIKFAKKDSFFKIKNIESANYDFSKFKNYKIESRGPYNYNLKLFKKKIIGY